MLASKTTITIDTETLLIILYTSVNLILRFNWKSRLFWTGVIKIIKKAISPPTLSYITLALLWYSLLFSLCLFCSKAPSGSSIAESIMTVSLENRAIEYTYMHVKIIIQQLDIGCLCLLCLGILKLLSIFLKYKSLPLKHACIRVHTIHFIWIKSVLKNWPSNFHIVFQS